MSSSSSFTPLAAGTSRSGPIRGTRRRASFIPASTDNTDKGQLKLWQDAPLDGATKTFQLVRPKNSSLVFGPGIGALAEMPDRITVVNGLAMNTVAHPDGSTYSATGRHPQGGRVAASSIDTMLANELGLEQLLPTVSLRFPSAFVGDNLDRRAVPLAVDDVGSVGRTLFRAQMYDANPERDKVTAVLSEEAADLASRSTYPGALDGLDLQYKSLRRMLGTNLGDVFTANKLKQLHPEFDYKARFGAGPVRERGVRGRGDEAQYRAVRQLPSSAVFDTHGTNYKTQAQNQQELFDMIAQLLRKARRDAASDQTGPQALRAHAYPRRERVLPNAADQSRDGPRSLSK